MGFGEHIGGKTVEKGTMCKMARGEMVRYLAENGAEQVVYAHSHGESRFYDSIPGEKNGVAYKPVSGGSMSGLESDAIGGFNSLINKQKKEDGELCAVLQQQV